MLSIDNLLVRIDIIWWTGLAPWQFEFPFPGSLMFTFLCGMQVKVSVSTTMAKMTETWDKLSGYAINEALATACLPPARVSQVHT